MNLEVNTIAHIGEAYGLYDFLWQCLTCILWGVAVSNMMKGFAINGEMIYKGTFFDLLSLYTIVGGITFLLVFAYHGTVFLTLRLADTKMIDRLRIVSVCLGGTAAIFYVLCLILTALNTDMFASISSVILFILAAVSFVASILLVYKNNNMLKDLSVLL